MRLGLDDDSREISRLIRALVVIVVVVERYSSLLKELKFTDKENIPHRLIDRCVVAHSLFSR